jgi:hypothetical protein
MELVGVGDADNGKVRSRIGFRVFAFPHGHMVIYSAEAREGK